METLSSISPNDAAALARLLGQPLTIATFDSGRLHAIFYHEATELIVARVGGEIVGMATFVSFPLPTGLRGHVEDVVVDKSMRGRGIARKAPRDHDNDGPGSAACERSTSPRDRRANRLCGSTRARVPTTRNEHPPIHTLASPVSAAGRQGPALRPAVCR